MRLILALTIILNLMLGLAAFASAESNELQQTDLSSNWAHEAGFQEISENRSKAALFLNAIRPEELQKIPALAPVDDSKSTSQR